MKKTINIGGKDFPMECNALLPRIYRKEFGRDVMTEMRKMSERSQKDPEDIDTEVLENITWLMLKAAGNDVGESVDEWLATLDDVMAVYMAMPEVIDLWVNNQKTTSKPKKK